MHKQFAVLFALAGALVASAQTPPETRPWTILVYGAADNNADGPILEFLDRVRAAIDDDPGIELLLLLDRSDKFSTDARSLGEDFTGARLYRLRKNSAERLSGGKELPEITLDKDVEIDSGDASYVGRFIAWGKAHCPAQRYALLIYSHADGKTMCPDEQSQGAMGIAELTDAAGPEMHVDFLALELCNMGGIEIAYQWQPGNQRFNAEVLLAIPNAGPPLDWDRAFARIRSAGHDTAAGRPPIDPSGMSAADFGKLVIEEGYRGRSAHPRGMAQGPSRESAGCYDLRAAAGVKKSLDALARALAKSSSKDAFLALREPCLNYTGKGPYVDLYDLCSRAAASSKLSAEVRKAADEVLAPLDAFVLDSFGMEGYAGFQPGKHGVFIVLPPSETGIWKRFTWYTPLPLTGRDYGRWSFLADGATAGNNSIENWFELLDAWFDDADENGGLNGYRP